VNSTDNEKTKAQHYEAAEGLGENLASPFLTPSDGPCPDDFLALVGKIEPRPIGFVRAVGSAILETARDAAAAGLCVPVLVGEADQIEVDAAAIGWDISGVEIIDTKGEHGAIEAAVELVKAGHLKGLIKGQLHTDVFMGAIVRRASGIRTEKRLLHIFAMVPPKGGRPLLISDAAVNISPDIKTRVEAALQMASLVRKMGAKMPRIAILSATEIVLPAMLSSGEAAEIASAARALDRQAIYAGPLSFDLAISPASAAIKAIDPATPEGMVAGFADAVVVPDIVSGNILFKSLAYCAGGLAGGLVVGGNVPIMLTSRSDPPAARLASLALAAIAGRKEQE
jgi:phosphate acetyltransferase